MIARRKLGVLLFSAVFASVRAATATASVGAQAAPAPAPPPSGVRSGLVVSPDTVAVGDPFALVVTVVVPAGARVDWGSIEDTAAVVAMRAPVRVNTVPDGTSRRETATYSLAAWDVGTLALGVPNPTVRIGNTTVRVPIESASIFVRSVLPGDTTLHVPKPAKTMFPRVIPWWEKWWPAAAVIAGLLLLWYLFRRRRRAPEVRRAAPLDPFARAMHDFDRLERLSLADAGERGRGVALAVEILRSYLLARVPAAALSLTSGELLEATAEDERVPSERLFYLLDDADAIKFARRPVSSARARELAGEARGIVEQIEETERARVAEEAARRAREAELEQKERAVEEDTARRRSRKKAGAR